MTPVPSDTPGLETSPPSALSSLSSSPTAEGNGTSKMSPTIGETKTTSLSLEPTLNFPSTEEYQHLGLCPESSENQYPLRLSSGKLDHAVTLSAPLRNNEPNESNKQQHTHPFSSSPAHPLPSSPLTLRPYQKTVVKKVGTTNAIIKMPTGSGKTFVAAELIKRRLLDRLPAHRHRAALFLVPTCDLMEQQSDAIQEWMPRHAIVRYKGGASTPPLDDSYDVIVSTPQAFLTLQSAVDKFNWGYFCIVIFDEVHHVLKDHPYRMIALAIPKWNEGIQVVGMSASLTYAVGEVHVMKELGRLTRELGIETTVSPTTAELVEGGYTPQLDNVEVLDCKNTPEDVVPEDERQYHLAHMTFFQRVKRGAGTYFSNLYFKAVWQLEELAMRYYKGFKSPLREVKLSSWEEYAHKLAAQADVRGDEASAFLFKSMETWYVGLRMLVQSWEEDEELVLYWLKLHNAFDVLKGWDDDLRNAIRPLKDMAANEHNFMKLNILCNQMQIKSKHFETKLRAVIFVRQRITAYILSHYLNTNNTFHGTCHLKAGYIAARGSKITPSIKVTPSQAKATIQQFRNGQIDAIVATSVIEEGFDVPAANMVISFDHLKDSVELCQRFGRARQENCAIIVMDERKDRPVKKLQKVRTHQDSIIETFDPTEVEYDTEAEINVQKNLERYAQRYLDDIPKCESQPAQQAHMYAQKTRATLEETFRNEKNGQFYCEVKYESILRRVRTLGIGVSKKMAKNHSSMNLLIELRRCTHR